jgi:hypothetical protein
MVPRLGILLSLVGIAYSLVFFQPLVIVVTPTAGVGGATLGFVSSARHLGRPGDCTAAIVLGLLTLPWSLFVYVACGHK